MVFQDFDFFRTIVKNKSGIDLEEDKAYLIESRLQSVVKKYSFKTTDDVVNAVKNHQNDDMIYDIIESVVTNETSFFRDIKVFENIKTKVIPALLSGNKEKTRVWCAACSTGQEAYSYSIALTEHLKGKDFHITGTDLSKKVLEKAISGEYTQLEVQRGLPVMMLMKHFDNKDEMWFVHNDLKNRIDFKELNLVDNYDSIVTSEFDIISCRNVLIYFNTDTKFDVLRKMHQKLSKDGFLILGATENVNGLESLYKPLENAPGIFTVIK